MSPSVTPSIDNLALAWQSIDALCADLTEDQWKTPTGCPGWSVQDNIAHLVDYESRAIGRKGPEHDPGEASHIRNELGASNEVGVDARRSRPGAEVLDELREVTAERLARLQQLTEADLEREVRGPVGPGKLRDLLTLRVMDTWSHEQDIRRALGRPGHVSGPVVDEAVGYFALFLPFLIGKRAGAPEGSTAVVRVGDVHESAVRIVDGKGEAAAVTDVSSPPTVTLTMPVTTFAALINGRSDVPDDVTIDGDTELGSRIVANMGFMP